jgi:hypothetical protein
MKKPKKIAFLILECCKREDYDNFHTSSLKKPNKYDDNIIKGIKKLRPQNINRFLKESNFFNRETKPPKKGKVSKNKPWSIKINKKSFLGLCNYFHERGLFKDVINTPYFEDHYGGILLQKFMLLDIPHKLDFKKDFDYIDNLYYMKARERILKPKLKSYFKSWRNVKDITKEEKEINKKHRKILKKYNREVEELKIKLIKNDFKKGIPKTIESEIKSMKLSEVLRILFDPSCISHETLYYILNMNDNQLKEIYKLFSNINIRRQVRKS